jgi:hypothetical protein
LFIILLGKPSIASDDIAGHELFIFLACHMAFTPNQLHQHDLQALGQLW